MSPVLELEQILYKRITDKINNQRVKAGLNPAAGNKLDEIVKQKLFVIYALVNEDMNQVLNTQITVFNKYMKVTPEMYKLARQLFAEEIQIWKAFNEAILKLGMSEELALAKTLERFKLVQ